MSINFYHNPFQLITKANDQTIKFLRILLFSLQHSLFLSLWAFLRYFSLMHKRHCIRFGFDFLYSRRSGKQMKMMKVVYLAGIYLSSVLCSARLSLWSSQHHWQWEWPIFLTNNQKLVKPVSVAIELSTAVRIVQFMVLGFFFLRRFIVRQPSAAMV